MSQPEHPIAGSGPLYPHTPTGLAAAEEPVHIPGLDTDPERKDGTTEPDSMSNPHPTGEQQAEDNRENEPPL
jgi:hypothetical protein